ncbi:MAG: insulinase family protein, partial [Bacteroidales bacterium]|nr:insulinase family protein [Bacteroidales bacterium]
SRLYSKLVKEQQIFSEIHAYITGDIDNGLFIFTGKPVKGVSIKDAEKAMNAEIEKIKNEPVLEEELIKVKNKIESSLEFSEMNVLNKAMNLAYSELLGDANLINLEKKKYNSVTTKGISRISNEIFTNENCTTLYYNAN